MVFYDRYGNPCCYSDDYIHIYGYGGEPLGYIQDGNVWNYYGKYLGLFRNNWILDRYGYYLFFTETAIGGPLRPLRRLAPLKAPKKIRPLKSLREIPPIPSIPVQAWSNLDLEGFFYV